MSGTWRQQDLGGGGLQAANLALARRLKRRRRAYALLALAPLGLHRAYLDSPRGAWAWRAAGVAAILLAWQGGGAGIAGAVLLLLAAGAEAFWIDRRITLLNKRIRREVYLAQGAEPPPGYRGRDPEGGLRTPSFAEQERLLREIAARKRPPAVRR